MGLIKILYYYENNYYINQHEDWDIQISKTFLVLTFILL